MILTIFGSIRGHHGVNEYHFNICLEQFWYFHFLGAFCVLLGQKRVISRGSKTIETPNPILKRTLRGLASTIPLIKCTVSYVICSEETRITVIINMIPFLGFAADWRRCSATL